MDLVVSNATIFNGKELLENHSLVIRDGRIAEIHSSGIPRKSGVRNINLDGNYLVPAFIDLQVNGGNGAFFTKEIDISSIEKISEANRTRGTLHILPTLVTTSPENIFKAFEVIEEAMKRPELGIIGMHLEGPFLNPIKKGAHNPKHLIHPTDELIKEILARGAEALKLITIAPELFTEKQIKMIQDAGVVVAAGHSMLDYPTAINHYDGAIDMATHLYNAMSPFQSRAPGLVGATLQHPEVWASIIVDGVHVDFASVEIAYKLKKGRLLLVSDAIFVGENRKQFMYDGFEIFFRNGQYSTADGTLVGATICILDAVKNCVKEIGIPLEEALRMGSLYPAQVMGVDNLLGSIGTGKKADLLVLDKALNLRGTFSEQQYESFHTN